MARTKSSRGAAPFQLKSGNSPMSLFGLGGTKVGQFFNKVVNKTPIVQGINALKGGGGGSVKERLDRIEQKIDQASSEPGSADAIAGNQDIDPAELSAGKAKKIAMRGGGDEELLQTEV